MPSPPRPTPTPAECGPLFQHAYNGQFNDLREAATSLASAKNISVTLLLALAQDAQGRGVAHHAARRDHAHNRVIIVRVLGLFAAAEPGRARGFLAAGDHNGDTPLHYAADRGHAAMLLLLLQRGARPNALNRAHETALHRAVRRGHMAMIGHLLADGRGTRLNARDKDGRSALHLAARRGDVQVVAALVTARHTDDQAAAIMAAQRPETEVASLTLVDGFNNTVLHGAVRSRHRALVAQLAARGAPVNGQNRLGSTPLHVAVTLGDLDTTDHLLASCRADGTIRDVLGRTPRDLAVQGGFQEIAMLLQYYGY